MHRGEEMKRSPFLTVCAVQLGLIAFAVGCGGDPASTTTAFDVPTTNAAPVSTSASTPTTAAVASDNGLLVTSSGSRIDVLARFEPGGVETLEWGSFPSAATVNARGDWAIEQDYGARLEGSIGGNSFGLQADNASEFTQGPVHKYYYPRLSPAGTLFFIYGALENGATVERNSPIVDSCLYMWDYPFEGSGKVVYRWTNPVSSYPSSRFGEASSTMPAWIPCGDFSRAIIVERGPDSTEATLVSISIPDGKVLYEWSVRDFDLLNGEAFDQSSDGRIVVYRDAAGYDSNARLVVVDVDKKTTRTLVESKQGFVPFDRGIAPNEDDWIFYPVSVSPDGSQVLATRYTKGATASLSISVFSTSTGEERSLTSDSGTRQCFEACWFPSGQKIAFVTKNAGPAIQGLELWTMNADGSEKQKLSDISTFGALRFPL
jgi:hypothetical protein